MRIVKWSVAAIVVVAVALVAFVYYYLRSTLPDYEGEVTTAELGSEVEIIRDSYGMPHIYAATDHDVYFALGFCIAQDRLFQMDMVRRTVHGRLAEVLGERLIEADRLFRTITAAKSPEEMAAELPTEVRAALEAFSAGVNYYLSEHKGSLPVEFLLAGYEPENWEPADCAAVLYYMAWMLNFSFSTEMLHAAVVDEVGRELAADIFVEYPAGYPTIIPDTNLTIQNRNLEVLRTLNLARELVGGDGRGASNGWVIGSGKSKTGKPILANDMHLGLGLPGIWYEAHLVTPEMNVSGVLAPGIPFVTVGANDRVAWGFTNVMADDADYYREKLKPGNPTQYEYLGRWEQMEIKKETIPVKGGEDIQFEVRLTRHGPLINDFTEFEKPPDEALVMRWVLADLHQEAAALYMLNRARSVEDIEKAVEFFKCPGQNWVYADDQGNIGYWAAVGIPVREGFDGALPVPGWDGEYEWAGYVPTTEQPHLKNPARGWIASANNKHTGEDYPHPISHYYAMPDRIERIERLLKEKEKLGVEDFERMHADLYMVLAEEWVPVIIAALEKESLARTEMQALEILRQWDFVALPNAVAPTIFHAIVGYMIEFTFRKRLGEDLYEQYIKSVWRAHNALRELIADGESLWFDDPETSEREQLTDIIRTSFAKAVKYLKDEMGNNIDRWRWGDLHTLTLAHPVGRASALAGYFMNVGPFPIGGGISTVNPSPYRLTHRWGTFAGASMRYIIDLGDIRNSRRVIPAGISGNFMSPHYDDQVELWRNVEYRPFLLQRDEVEKDAAHIMTLRPE